MRELTPAQQRVLDFVEGEIRSGQPAPTLREIAERFKFRSHRAAACHLQAIKRKGYLESEPRKARALRVISPLKLRGRVMNVPLFGSIPAGTPQNQQQEAEGCVSVDTESIGFTPTRNTFALRVSGDSMIGRQILDGDIVVMEHGLEPLDGDVVAALIDGESTLKTLVRKDGGPYLKAENPKYPDRVPLQDLMVQGVLKALIRRARK